MWPNPQEIVDLIVFTEEILNGKLHFLCSDGLRNKPLFLISTAQKKIFSIKDNHCVESVRFRSSSGPYSVRMRENTDQKNSEYGHFSYSELK